MRSVVLVLLSFAATAGRAAGSADPPPLVLASGSPMSLPGGPGNLALGDLNNDGSPDLVVASARSRSVWVLLGHGDGRFTPKPGGPLAVSENPHEIGLGDVDGDGNLDLALASHDGYGVTLLVGDGRGDFRVAPSSPIVMKDGRRPHTHGLGIADLNGDDHADLVTVNSNDDNDVAVVLGDGRGGFARAPGSPFPVGPSPYPSAFGDINGDGTVDMVVTSTGLGTADARAAASSGALTALFGDGRGGFRRSDIPMRTPRTWFVVIGDVDGDQRPDLVTTHTEDRLLSVLVGDGYGSFTEVADSPFDLGHDAWAIGLADLNRDGKNDVVAAAGDGVRVMLGDGRGAFAPAPGSPFAAGKGTWKLTVGDLNADGAPDVAATNLESDSVTVWLGRGLRSDPRPRSPAAESKDEGDAPPR
jgi:hypothetical protein